LKAHAKTAQPIPKFWRMSRLYSIVAPKAPLYSRISSKAPESSNTRIIARWDREWERYFAYAIALRTASGNRSETGRALNAQQQRFSVILSEAKNL
jgi:hypothetical protein